MKNLVTMFEATMTTVFNETKENDPSADAVAGMGLGMSTPEKLIGRSCEHSGMTTPAKKRCRMNSIPLSAIPVWRPEPSNIWTKVTKDYSSRTRSVAVCPPSQYKIGSKRRHAGRQCPCKRPILDFSKMCETSYHKVNDKKDSIVIPKGIGLDIVSLCEDSASFSIRPIQLQKDNLCIFNKTSLSTVNIDLDSIERY